MVEFASFTEEEQAHVDRIVARGLAVLLAAGYSKDREDVEMDISAVHAKNPLRLQEFADADDFDFNHDIGLIHNCLNRKTGELERGLPRFTMFQKDRAKYLKAKRSSKKARAN